MTLRTPLTTRGVRLSLRDVNKTWRGGWSHENLWFLEKSFLSRPYTRRVVFQCLSESESLPTQESSRD